MTIEESIKQQIRYVVKRNIRALRIKNDETIIYMAKKLEISIVELSAIENSKIGDSCPHTRDSSRELGHA